MSLNPIYERASSMLAWLSQPEARVMLTDLEKTRQSTLRDIRTETDVLKLGRLQGKLEALDKVLDLPEKLKEHLAKESQGAYKPKV